MFGLNDSQMDANLNGEQFRRISRHERKIMRAERWIICAFALWLIYLWGLEPILHRFGL